MADSLATIARDRHRARLATDGSAKPATGCAGPTVAFISTYPPRECGLATFTDDLATGMRGLPRPSAAVVAAIDAAGEHHNYRSAVVARIEELDPRSYIEAARVLNGLPGVDIVSVQHDYGRFGIWRDEFEQDYLLPMLDELEKPAVVTMHTVTPHPNALMRRTVQAMAGRAAALVVMANIAKVLLQEDYGLDAAALETVQQIPHGVPATPRRLPALDTAKRALGLWGHRVLSTFGLLNEGKGIEYAIAALPALVGTYPDLLYLVIGETHPEVRKLRGEGYRRELLALARRLGVERHVRFVNRYLAQPDLVRYLAATDVYVTPYLARYQITSGTLAYALGCGKAIVSTPYLYAAEALAEGRGLLAEFRSADSIAAAVGQLLGNPELRRHVEEQAARYGRQMAWPVVAQRYQQLFADILGEQRLAAPAFEAPTESYGEKAAELVAILGGD